MVGLCFFNKECIKKREEEEAKRLAEVQKQQQLLLNISDKPTGGLPTWAIASIIIATIGLSAFIIYKIKNRKNK